MAKVLSDVGAIAEAWKATLDVISKFIGGAKGRRTRKALKSAQIALNRAKKLYPKLAKDKQFKKNDKAFRNNLI